ncbi:MAG: beta-galactosidase [Alistipes sp.]|uniref:glycoside hydrolase family 2 protein n=1 Tax=Alistipes sp. TaxID=1872444 RepID=UPI0025BE7B59|nr:sugar-binding domain-containing protein [Alistipes sp.]MCD8273874.1 beta-galactosidase [Alistipes sp.]
MNRRLSHLLLAGALLLTTTVSAEWKPAGDKIKTRWTDRVDPRCPLPEYPRPQLVRPHWQNLNGLWDYAVTEIGAAAPAGADGKILVPFGIESSLSGVQRTFLPTEKLWYRRSFEVPAAWRGKRILLHFGAVDYTAAVRINDREAGTHEGGNDAFTFDITELLRENGPQEVSVEVTDPTDKGRQPRGKQVLNPKGIHYTPVSGIWKTVWLEAVDPLYIASYHGTPDIDRGQYVVSADVPNATAATQVKFEAYDKGRRVAEATVRPGEKAVLRITDAKLWSPASPFLYDLKMTVFENGKRTDAADSYFGMRKISVGKDADGFDRILLNGEFVFQYGLLDQGWWPDGLLTAPTEEALLYDIEFTLKAGFNTIRKHIKVESDRFYYHCDRLGVLVWQDAVSGDDYNLKDYPHGIDKDPEAAHRYEKELKAMIDQLRNYPSIVNWVVFNEGWGQYGGKQLIDWVKKYDPSRLAEVSGWVDMGNGDIADIHKYPGPGRVENAGPGRAFVVGEFGGLGLPTEGHLWNPAMNNWGYATYKDPEKFRKAYRHMVFQLRTMISEGLSGAIYTQTSDVEGEVNGLMTYDRAVEKFPEGELYALHQPLYAPDLSLRTVLEDAARKPQQWYYTMEKPAEGWQKSTAPPAGWKQGEAPFGFNHPDGVLSFPYYERTDPAHLARTEWKGRHLWAWREFDLKEVPGNVYVRPRYDRNVTVFVNGRKVADVRNRQPHYYHSDLLPLPDGILRPGRNVIAVHAERNPDLERSKNVMFDAGLVEVVQKSGNKR